MEGREDGKKEREGEKEGGELRGETGRSCVSLQHPRPPPSQARRGREEKEQASSPPPFPLHNSGGSPEKERAKMLQLWKSLAVAVLAGTVLGLRAEEEPMSKSKICANVFCGAGRECAVTEKSEPTCLCIERCKPHKRPVCGSNGKTYLNHCELHRDACLTGSKIQVDYDGHCKEKKPENSAASPVVCYQTDRDELRRRVIQWLETEIIPDGWFSKGNNYTEILDKYFKNFDDGDSRLDSSEFLKFVEQNETAVNITTYVNQETNKLLRGLCVDALIELSDENADWKLSFNEFLKCLNPAFNPPEKKCALEDETYEDGAETQVECNRCVCACGNWVCTAMTCEGKNQKVLSEGQQPEDKMTEEELARYVQELQKHQETSEKTKRTTTKEM
ncbi:follistatin-related protein 1 [Lacerta agilis]|uniref:follistatin-related protein 1 n=1 Tax=Lacerta agilis TaxID=80427 RepID=UPI001419160F|nr:follistatin-related protein 1 [Lacerta agilis]